MVTTPIPRARACRSALRPRTRASSSRGSLPGPKASMMHAVIAGRLGPESPAGGNSLKRLATAVSVPRRSSDSAPSASSGADGSAPVPDTATYIPCSPCAMACKWPETKAGAGSCRFRSSAGRRLAVSAIERAKKACSPPSGTAVYLERNHMRFRPSFVSLLVLTIGLSVTPVLADKRSDAKEHVDFGIAVAQRGLWREAAFRWRQAVELDPTYAEAWNNL